MRHLCMCMDYVCIGGCIFAGMYVCVCVYLFKNVIPNIFRFDSRDIFPAGWCSSSGHPLQPPGMKAFPGRLEGIAW